jgi:hypothetical protein
MLPTHPITTVVLLERSPSLNDGMPRVIRAESTIILKRKGVQAGYYKIENGDSPAIYYTLLAPRIYAL